MKETIKHNPSYSTEYKEIYSRNLEVEDKNNFPKYLTK